MQRFRLGAVTDVFSPDVAAAASKMGELGLHGAEIRTLNGRNILEMDRGEMKTALAALQANQLKAVAIATPLLKCTLDDWKAQSQHVDHVFDLANLAGARIVRVFSGSRVTEPAAVFERVVDILQDLADKAGHRDLIIGIENDRACNVSTAQEVAGLLSAIDHSNLQVVWDPASAYISGEKPFPTGYRMLDAGRIALVHAKDCTLEGHKPVWEPLGEGDIDWQGQIDALAEDGYDGFIDVETYWSGIADCVRNLKRMAQSPAL